MPPVETLEYRWEVRLVEGRAIGGQTEYLVHSEMYKKRRWIGCKLLVNYDSTVLLSLRCYYTAIKRPVPLS